MEFFDTHCHLNLSEYDHKLDQVISIARENKVKYFVVPGIDIETSKKAIKIAEMHKNVFVSAGIHPNDGLKWNNHSYEELLMLTNHPKVVAVGEIGLDKHWDDCSYDRQIFVLHEQLKLAKEKKLPVILHSRETMTELLEIITDWTEKVSHPEKTPGVFHSFEGNLIDAKKVIKLGFMVGLGGPITFKNAAIKQTLGSSLPLTSILLETDSPFLAPIPHRGKKNEPGYLPIIAEKIASLRSIPVQVVAEQTTANAKSLFFRSDH